ncbi:MAG: hypothetical protein JXR34_00900 [Bacteroidales bacterium]|nr:hypothetical protein [Bacteroidales bacterium]
MPVIEEEILTSSTFETDGISVVDTSDVKAEEQSGFFSVLENTITSRVNNGYNFQLESFFTDYKGLVESSNFVLHNWKNVENVPARLVSYSSCNVVLECLMDKEKRIYQERTFPASIFDEMELQEGKLFYLRLFERPSEMKLQVLDDPSLILEDDFPKSRLAEKYKSSRLFKR